MRVALVLAPAWTVETPPLSLASLAAWLEREGHEARCVDLNVRAYRGIAAERARELWDLRNQPLWLDDAAEATCAELWPVLTAGLEEALEDFRPDVLGFSLYATSIRSSFALARHAKTIRPELPVVFGGPPCHSDAEGGGRSYFLSFEEVDAVVQVEGEQALVALVEQVAEAGRFTHPVPGSIVRVDGEHRHGPPGLKVKPLDGLPDPLFRDLPLGPYRKRSLPIQISRGCVARCTFCAEAGWWGMFRTKSPARVVDEMVAGLERYDATGFVFVDSLINGSMPRLKELAEEIVRRDLQLEFEGNARVHPGMDEEMMALLARAGCRQLKIGLESAAPKVLRDMRKGTKVEDASRVLKLARKVGIEASTDWLVGYPTERWIDFWQSLLFIARHRDALGVVNSNVDGCAVLPGARLHSDPGKWGVEEHRSATEWTGPGGMNDPHTRRLKGRIFKRVVGALGIAQAN